MDVNIGEMSSTVRVTDSQSLVNPQVLDRIVHAVMLRLREQEASEQRRKEETRVKNGMAGEQEGDWS